MTTKKPLNRMFITKSKAGHYKVTVWENNMRKWNSAKLSGLHTAQNVVASIKENGLESVAHLGAK